MLKRRYVKRAYIEEVYCDKCGAPMHHTGMVLTSYPAQYPFECSNPDCDGRTTFWEGKVPGVLKYEFEEEEEDV
jgi:hypothetical protein